MKALIQRVSEASVTVEGECIGRIERGLLILLGVERGDTEASADKLVHRISHYRIFPDEEGRMNRSLLDMGGAALVVSQFTLAADTRKGMRPGFSTAAPPEEGERLYEYFVAGMAERLPRVATGRFGADMKVSLVNDGPVTFLLEA